jgi:hypothetical protein
MSKHYANAFTVLCIAVVSGILLAPPAFAGPIDGIQAMEPVQLSALAITGAAEPLVASVNGLQLQEIPASPAEEAAPDEEPVEAVTPVPEGLPDTAMGLMPSGEENAAETSASLPDEALPDTFGGYDDEELDDLIVASNIRLMQASMRHAHALYLQDEDSAAAAADDLHAASAAVLDEVQSLRVSPDRQPLQAGFIGTLERYAGAGAALANRTESEDADVASALASVEGASADLEILYWQVSALTRSSSETSGSSNASAPVTYEHSAVLAEPAPGPVLAPPKVLALRERHCYDDYAGENMISLMVDSYRNATAYRAVQENETEISATASEGRFFLLVAVKATNLGHKGDSDVYTIQTPPRSAFTLRCQGSEYAPLDLPGFTTLGESYDLKDLNRYDSQKAYLVFDLPQSLNVSEAVIHADLGYAGSPAWDLGRSPGLPVAE